MNLIIHLKRFVNENGLFEGLHAYKSVIDEYQLEVSEELWALVINYINSEAFQG